MTYYCKLIQEENGYFVEFPDLPNVFTEGEDKETALKNAVEALNGVLETDVSRCFIPESPKTKEQNLYPIEVAPHIDLAIQLRKIRGDKSQKTIAGKIGLSYQAYQKLENPIKGNPTIKTLEKLAKALGEAFTINFGR